MKNYTQVDKSHYRFEMYMNKCRWASVWHQLDEVIQLQPASVLEIGPGPGVFKHMATLFGISVETLDFDPDLKPDHVGSATALPFAEGSYDVVCAFQMLEHLPYSDALQAFAEMRRVSRRHVVISLPDAKQVWRYSLHVPKFGSFDFLVPRPTFKLAKHTFNGEHHWEINKRGYALDRVIRDFEKFAFLMKTYRVFANPYHRFFLFERLSATSSLLREEQ